ncbi:DUF4255 domain-containing protein [Streptomyces sp. S465]|uniref:DUF4255 domain-containing protein n=1 Tax=Streptomyces sp. S465 TaxID=2979468 RepID=UPI0022A8BB1A|nr:DUF4255 domain-containing protein [Streptomyces sp. S465]WAP60468.1 DUF4255 domain-containing protein [Streptomyces sp. S465]
MIHEVDEGLRRLLGECELEASGIEVVFDAPTRDWAARRSAPTVCVFLYDIRQDATRRGAGDREVYDADGHVVARRAPARWFTLTYLVTAWANRPQDEHRLLSQVLACLVATETLPARLLTGSLAELGLTVGLDTAEAGLDAPTAADVWSALGGELKASLGVRVRAPLAGISTAVAPPVTEGLVTRSAARDSGGDATPGRRLRYTGTTDPGPNGFAGPRERQPAPARRRRRGDHRDDSRGDDRGDRRP